MIKASVLEKFAEHSTKCNQILSRLHEACSPFITSKDRETYGIEDDYGGITGAIIPSHVQRVARVLITGKREDTDEQFLSDEYLLRDSESVFCDIGSGTGRPSFYFGCLPIRCSMGFDVDTLQVLNSCAGHKRLLDQGVRFSCPVTFFKENALQLANLEPTTHAYAFIGYPDFAFAIARLIANSPSIKVFIAVVLRVRELIESGFLASAYDEDVVSLTSMKMSGGNSYLGLVIPMTPSRRKRMKMILAKQQSISEPVIMDKMDSVHEKFAEAMRRGATEPSPPPAESNSRPRRACSILKTRESASTPSSQIVARNFVSSDQVASISPSKSAANPHPRSVLTPRKRTRLQRMIKQSDELET